MQFILANSNLREVGNFDFVQCNQLPFVTDTRIHNLYTKASCKNISSVKSSFLSQCNLTHLKLIHATNLNVF